MLGRLLVLLGMGILLAGGLSAAESGHLAEAEAAWTAGELDRAQRQARLALADELTAAQRTRAEELLQRITARRQELAEEGDAAVQQLAVERERVRALLGDGDLSAADWQAYEDFRRRYPGDPLLQEIDARFRPGWAAQAGVDDHGTWASCRIGRTLVRFRLVSAGSLALPDGRRLELARDLWVAEYEATAGLRGPMGCGEAASREGLPCTGLSLENLLAGLAVLREGAGSVAFRLPTPTEWEYAARAGCTDDFLPGFAGLEDGAFDRHGPVEVGSFAPNAWGLYDIHGGVWELVRDRFGVCWRRGGGWRSRYEACSLAAVHPVQSHVAYRSVGFRLVIDGGPAAAEAEP